MSDFNARRSKRMSAPPAMLAAPGQTKGTGHFLESGQLQSMSNLLDDNETEMIGGAGTRERRSKRSSAFAAIQTAAPAPRSHKAAIRILHAFGSHSNDTGAVLVDDNTVLYRSGRWLISQPLDAAAAAAARSTAAAAEPPKLTFVYPLEADVTRVTAYCVSDNKKYLALCELRESQVRIIHLQSRRSICVLSAALDAPLIGCSFSSDAKHVLAYSAAPENVTVVWQWAEERPVGMHRSRTPLSRVRFNPWIGSLISLNSPLRLARLNEQGHFKEIEVTAIKRHGSHAADHCWLAPKLLVFADTGGVVRVVEESTVKQTLTRKGVVPTVVTALPRGFLVGCDNGDVLCFLRTARHDTVDANLADEPYVLQGIFKDPSVQHGAPVRSIATSGRDGMTALIHGGDFHLAKIEELLIAGKTSTASVEASVTGGGGPEAAGGGMASGGVAGASALEEASNVDGGITPVPYEAIEPLKQGHASRIAALSAAVAKPLLVSVSDDKTLRVWDMRTMRCRLVESLREAPIGVSIHPDGLSLSLAYDGMLAFSHIGIDCLLPWRDVPLPNVHAVLYAHGGHLLAAAFGHTVAIFDAYHLTRVAHLNGHLSPCTTLAWSADDSALTSGGADGMFYSWSATSFTRFHECRLHKGSSVTALGVLSAPRQIVDENGDVVRAGTGSASADTDEKGDLVGSGSGSAEADPVGGGGGGGGGGLGGGLSMMGASRSSLDSSLGENALAEKLPEHSVLVVSSGGEGGGGGGGGGQPESTGRRRSLTTAGAPGAAGGERRRSLGGRRPSMAMHDDGGGSPAAAGAGPDGALADSRSVLRMIQRTDEQYELSLGGESLSAITSMPAARLAFCGTVAGSLLTVQCAKGERDKEKLSLKGAPVRPHNGSVTCVVASADERFVISGAADGSIFVFERPELAPPKALPAHLAPAAAMAPTAAPSSAAGNKLSGSGVEDALHTEVQCVTRESLERGQQELHLAKSALWQLQNSIATEEARTAARVQATLSKQTREHAETQAEAEKRLRKTIAAHNAEVAALHKRFGEVAAKGAESAKARQAQLEAALRKEIKSHDQASAQLEQVREQASEELARLSVAVEESREEKERLDEQAVEMIEEVKAGYEQDLGTLEAECEARQLQLLGEYDETLLHERTAATSAAEEAKTEIKSLGMQLFLQKKKMEKHAKEKEEANVELDKVEQRGEELLRRVADLEAQIHNLKREAASRERELADREKKIVAMHTSSQRLESNKRLLELRVKELEETREPILTQLYELKMTSKLLEKELVSEGERRRETEVEVDRLRNKERQGLSALRKAEQRALDSEQSHAATVSKVFQLLEGGADKRSMSEYVRHRDAELREADERRRMGGEAGGGGEGGGSGGVGRPPLEMVADAEAMKEAINQRDKMTATVEQLQRELTRTKAKAEKQASSLSSDAQQMHNMLNEQRRRGHELSQLVKQQEAQISYLNTKMARRKGPGNGPATGAMGASKSQPRLLPAALVDPAGPPPIPAPSPAPAGTTLQHSATAGELRPPGGKNAVADDLSRPETAPSFAHAVPAELAEQMESHLLENQRLRETLLWYTAKEAAASKKSRSAPSSSIGRPLPPV